MSPTPAATSSASTVVPGRHGSLLHGGGVGAALGSGVAVGTGVGVAVGAGVGVAVGAAVGVAVGAGVSPGGRAGARVGAGDGVAVGAGLGVAVGAGVGVAVGTGVGVGAGPRFGGADGEDANAAFRHANTLNPRIGAGAPPKKHRLTPAAAAEPGAIPIRSRQLGMRSDGIGFG